MILGKVILHSNQTRLMKRKSKNNTLRCLGRQSAFNSLRQISCQVKK